MDILSTIVLALIQGFTEFLPISSSAHLILLPKVFLWSDQGLLFDIVVHLGTLSALIYYYQTNVKELAFDLYGSIIGKKTFSETILVWGILLGTIPVGLVGLFFKDFIEFNLRSFQVIAYTTLIFGVLLGVADRLNRQRRKPREVINLMDIIFIGSMQALALIPGVSRSGITITAGLLIGLSLKFATRFAFLLAIPITLLLVMVLLIDVYDGGQPIYWEHLLIGFVVSMFSAYLTIYFFIKLLNTIGLMPFVIYRITLGGLLLVI